MEAKIYLSVPTDKRFQVNESALLCAEMASRACVSLNLPANVVPMFSSMPHTSKPTTLEVGARIDLLKIKDAWQILKLFGDLVDVLALHCVYLEVSGLWYTGHEHEFEQDYSGCILDWRYYQNRHTNIGHSTPRACSDCD